MPTLVHHTAGIILCGGHSRRMGTAKPWLQCGPEFLLQRMVRIVSAMTNHLVVANRPGNDIPPLPDNVQVVHDGVGNSGPLAGILAAFNALEKRSAAAFVIACDHPLLKPAFITRLIELLDTHSAVVPEISGRLQPLAAVYRLETRSIAAQMLSTGDQQAVTFAQRCSPRIVQRQDLAQCDPDLQSLMSCNDPESYRALLAKLDT